MNRVTALPRLLGLALTFAALSSAGATTHLVRPDGTGTFPTIAAAITGASAGDTIALADGIFTGAGNRNLDFAGKPLIVRSQSGVREACTIDCQSLGRAFVFQSGAATSSALENFTVTHGAEDFGAAILCRAGTAPRISNCRLIDNALSSGAHGVLACLEQAAPRIEDCYFFNNRGSYTVYLTSGALPSIVRCTFVNNYGTGVRADDAVATVTDCRFLQNFGDCIYLNSATGTLTGSVFAHHWNRPVYATHSNAQIANCTFVDNDNYSGSVLNYDQSTGTIINTIVAHSTGRSVIYCYQSTVTAACCDFFDNQLGNWTSCLAGQEGLNGNVSVDPLFCDADHDDYSVAGNSPCAPANSGCGLIGAGQVVCPSACIVSLSPERITTYAPCAGSLPLELWIGQVVKLGAFQLCLGYDAQKLTFDHVAIDPSFLGSTGRQVQPTSPSACVGDCGTAGIAIGASTSGGQAGPSGAGRLATTYWQPLQVSATSTSTLCLGTGDFESTDTPPVPISLATTHDVALTHRPFCYGDFNDNGDVSVQDVMQVASRWGRTWNGGSGYSDVYDVNLIAPGNYCASRPDSIINIVDVQSVAARWGLPCGAPLPGVAATNPLDPALDRRSASPRFTLTPEQLVIRGAVGQTGTFTLNVADAVDLGAYESTVSFDPAILHVESVEFLPYLASSGRVVYPLAPSIDNEVGTVTLGAWSTGSVAGVSGSGALARVTVSLHSCPGVSDLAITRAVATTPDGWKQSLGDPVGATVETVCGAPSATPSASLPTRVELLPNRPNPFANSTTITFAIPGAVGTSLPIELTIVDVGGRVVRHLASGSMEAGYHPIVWDGRDDRGASVSGGVYFSRLRVEEKELAKQIVLLP